MLSPMAMNDHGVWVGQHYRSGNATHACIWSGDDTAVHDLNEGKYTAQGPRPPDSCAYSVNNHNQVVGELDDEEGALLWQDGKTYELNDLIPPDTHVRVFTARGINDAGQIITVGDRAVWPPDKVGLRPFVLTPIVAGR